MASLHGLVDPLGDEKSTGNSKGNSGRTQTGRGGSTSVPPNTQTVEHDRGGRRDPDRMDLTRRRGPVDRRKIRYHLPEDAIVGASSFTVTKADRMSAEDAGDTLEKLFTSLMGGLGSEEEKTAFLMGMCFCHTINGGSILHPGRSTFGVNTETGSGTYEYQDVVNILGNDLRRFFRAFADETRQANRAVIDAFDPADIESVEKYSWLKEVAQDRGILRYPDLAHDSADACLGLTIPEREAVAASKRAVLMNTVNVADTVHSNSRFVKGGNLDGRGGGN